MSADDMLWTLQKTLRDYRDQVAGVLELIDVPDLVVTSALSAEDIRKFRELVDLLAQGRSLRDLSPPLKSTQAGHHHGSSNTITVNAERGAHPGSMLMTVAHEAFHAYQKQEIDKAEFGLPHDARAAIWEPIWSRDSDPTDPVERDADAFAEGAPHEPMECRGCPLSARHS